VTKLKEHLLAYGLVNALLLATWASIGGFCWPSAVIAVWGVIVAVHAWNVRVAGAETGPEADPPAQPRKRPIEHLHPRL
jgi:hypothetical protein